MHLMRLQPIIVPGWKGSGPAHWQSLWETRLPRAVRVQQANWDLPVLQDWVKTVAHAITSASRPPLLIAHSLGCITVAHLPMAIRQQVAGALLVAPADVERPGAPPVLQDFAPVPRLPLHFPSIVVASTDDPYCRPDRAREFAADWGSDIVELPDAGHINDVSNLGHWPQGLRLLATLRRRAGWRVPVAADRITAMPAPSRHS